MSFEGDVTESARIFFESVIKSNNSVIKELQHHKDTTVGLWATDRPDMIPENLLSEYFFEIK